MSAEAAHDDPVLIAGGGLVGLSAAMFLAQHGVSSLAIERLRGGSQLPRAAFFHMRTIELFRAAGIEDEVREQSLKEFTPEGAHRPDGHAVGQAARRLHSEPQRRRRCAQPLPPPVHHPAGLEPILRRRAEVAGAKVLAGHEVIGVAQDADGVTVTAQERKLRQGDQAARQISDRRRRRAQQGARIARRRIRRARRLLQQHHDLFPRQPRAAAAEQAAERDLYRQSDARRLLPHGQGLPVRLPVREHGRRSQDRSGGGVERGRRRQRAAADRVRARRRRRSRTCRSRSTASRAGARPPTWRAASRSAACSSPAMPRT